MTTRNILPLIWPPPRQLKLQVAMTKSGKIDCLQKWQSLPEFFLAETKSVGLFENLEKNMAQYKSSDELQQPLQLALGDALTGFVL